jgi:hypothetical protein
LQHDDAVAQPFDLGHVMRCEEDGRVFAAAIFLEMRSYPVGRIGIERCRRLVEKKDFRLVDKRLGESDARLLPGGQCATWPVEEIFECKLGG